MNFFTKNPKSNSRERFDTGNLYDAVDLSLYDYTSNFFLPPLTHEQLEEHHRKYVGISSSTPGAYGGNY